MLTNDIYDQFVSQFRQPSLMFRSNYYDYADKPSPFHDADNSFFIIHPERHSFFRRAFQGEFDYSPDGQPNSERLPKAQYLKTFGLPEGTMLKLLDHAPPLYVHVQRINRGTHNVTALFRGRAWWKTRYEEGRDVDAFRSDDELAANLKRISAIEGFDVKAWQEFAAIFNEIVGAHQQSIKATTVH